MKPWTSRCQLLLFIVAFSGMLHIATSNCRTIKARLDTKERYSDIIRLTEKAVNNLNVSFKITFDNSTTCCPIMNIRSTLAEEPPPARTCFNQARNLIANKHYISLSNTYGKKCVQKGKTLTCTDTQAFVYLQPRHWFVSFAYECGTKRKKLSLDYEFCVTDQVALDCKPLTVGNAMCDRNIDDSRPNYVLFPNRFGHKDSAEAFEYRRYIDVFSTLSDIEAQCYQHINIFTCSSLYPQCTPPKPGQTTHPSSTGDTGYITVDAATRTTENPSAVAPYSVPCRRMCQELFLGCKHVLEINGIIDCENYPDGLPPSTDCTYLKVECSTAGLDIVNGSVIISGVSLNHTVISHGVSLNATATYSCENDLDVVGNKTLTCLPSGRWSSPPPECLPAPPPKIPHLDVIICFSVAGVVLVTALVTLYICRRRGYRCCCRRVQVDIEIPLPPRQRIFISFCSDNHEDVDVFLQELDANIPRCEYFTYHGDFIAGDRIMDDIHKGVWESKGMLNFITQDFIDSPWCRTEFTQGFSRHRQENTFPFIAVLDMTDQERHQLRNVPHDMQTYLAQNVYLLRNEPTFWERLSRALPQA